MSTEDARILVVGATGTQGQATVERLLTLGHPVRALVRDPATEAAQALAATGAELAKGDLDAPETLAPALAGVHGVFATSPAAFVLTGWDIELETARGEALVDAAAAAGVDHYVFGSIAGTTDADLPGSIGKRRIEEHLAGSGMRWTVLRPVRFMENYLARGLPVDGLHGGRHRHMFHPDRPMQIVAVADIAEFTALAFADPGWFSGVTLDLAGDDPTPVQAAERISAATGREFRYERVPYEQAAELGEEIAGVWRLMDEGHGWQADLSALRKLHPGLRTLEHWLDEDGAERIKALPQE